MIKTMDESLTNPSILDIIKLVWIGTKYRIKRGDDKNDEKEDYSICNNDIGYN